MSDIRLLIVDEDNSVRSVIKEYAAKDDFSVDEAADGITALKFFRRNEYNIIILDTALPELDGRNVCRQIRKISDVPIIFISSEIDEDDILSSFEAGADDYVTKPFFASELMARVKVFLHRSSGQKLDSTRRISANGVLADTVSRVVYVDEKAVKLTPKEYDLLLFLMRNPNKAFSRDALLNEVWGNDFFVSDRTIDTYIKALRENLKPYQHYIATVWGFGYKFNS
jgi:DNA-binding response OmpR family regulator